MDKQLTSASLSLAYEQACLAEIEALKPGNVHIFADGHGMVVQDFIVSASSSAAVIALPNLSLGERVYQGVSASWEAVGCNTNLGIVLLCAPIVHAALAGVKSDLCDQIAKTIGETTQRDAEWVFQAVRLANPAGLGDDSKHDVKAPAKCTLLAAMQVAQDRDFIAKQYSNGYQQLIEEGLSQYQHAYARWENAAWATTAVYLFWLSHYLDTHIIRKWGIDIAQQVKVDALAHYDALLNSVNPKQYFSVLLQFDQVLKAKSINPGTSADLTVATNLLYRCINPGDC